MEETSKLAHTKQVGHYKFKRRLDLVDALYAVDAVDATYAGENGFELALVRYFQTGFDASVLAVGAAFESANVGAGVADDGRDFREEAGTILGADEEFDGESGGAATTPFDGDAAFGLIEKILDVGANAGVHGNAATPGDVSDDVVTGNGIAAFGAEDQQIVLTTDDERGFAKTQHALNGFNQRGLGIVGGLVRLLGGLAEIAGQDLAGGIFAKADGGEKIFGLGETVFSGELCQIFSRNFLEALGEIAGFIFEEALAHFGGFVAFLCVDEVANLAFRVRRFDETEPVAAGLVTFLREDFNDIAADDFVAKGDHLAVHFCADTLVPDFGVDGVGEIDGSSTLGQFEDAALGSEGIDFDGREIHF